MASLPDQESYLEAGLVAFALMMLGAGVALIVGRLSGRAATGRGHDAAAPQRGDIPRQRHQHISSNAAH